jgi:hypothetical protein
MEPGAVLINLSPDGSRAILSGLGIRVVDAVRFTTLERLEPTPGPSGYGRVTLTANGTRAYLPHYNPDEIGVFDLIPRACEPPAAGLAGFWPADGTTDDAHDGAPAELKNGAKFAPGRIGQAFRLDGGNDFVRIRKPAGTGISTIEGTIAAWVKFAKVGVEMSIADRFAPGGEIGWRLFTEPSGHFVFCLAGGTGCVSSTTIASAGRWYHVAGVRIASDLVLYVNGASEGSKRLAPPLAADGANDHPILNLGASQAPGAFLAGLIDEVVLYRRGLNAADVRQLVEAAHCVVPGG